MILWYWDPAKYHYSCHRNERTRSI